jgi:hypothetical protein
MRVQEIFEDRTPAEGAGSARSQLIFTGLLRCGCGAAMTSESANGNGGRYSYYNCSAALKGAGCSHRRIRARDFDGWMIDCIMDKILTKERMAEFVNNVHELAGNWVKERARRRESLTAYLRDTEKRLRNLYDILELHGKDAPNLGDLTERMRVLKGQRESLENQLIELENANCPAIDITAADIAQAADLMRDIVMTSDDPTKLRAFFGGFIKEIVLEDGDVRIAYHPGVLVNHAGFDVVHSSNDWLPELVLLRTKVIQFPLPERFHRKRRAA